MILYNIFILFVSIFLFSLIGNYFIKKNFIYNFAFGWLSLSILISFTAYFIPNLSREIIVLFIILSLLLNYSLQINYLFKTYFYFKKYFKIYLLFFFVSYLFFIDNSIFFVEFRSNDLLHHALALEMITVEEFGNIKFPFHYPIELGPYHLLSNSTLAVLNFLSMKPDMHLILETKMIIISLFFTSFLIFIHKFEKNIIKILFIVLSVFLLFLSEIRINIHVGSNYTFIILSILTIQLVFDEKLNYKKKVLLVLIFFIFQFHLKATFSYIFIPVILYIFLKNLNLIKEPSLWMCSIITLFVIINLILMPKGNGWLKAQSEFKIVFQDKQSLTSFVRYEPPFTENSNESNLIKIADDIYKKTQIPENLINKFSNFAQSEGGKKDLSLLINGAITGSLTIFIILIKYFFPLVYLNNKIRNQFKIEFNIFFITSLIGWLFVRNSSYFNPIHQSYIFFYLSMFVTFCLIYYLSKLKNYKKITALFLFIGLLNYLGTFENFLNFKQSYFFKAKNDKINLEINKLIEDCRDKKFQYFSPDKFTELASLILSNGTKMYCKHNSSKALFKYDEYLRHRKTY